MNRRSAVFLDRDGVINVDFGYVHRVEEFEFLPGIFELARFVVRRGWPLIVTTNQSGIARGYFNEATYLALTEWMCTRFRAEHAPITKVYYCPFHPEFGIGHYRADHDWRKPKPGMFLQAARDFDLELSDSIVIGDRTSDMEAAAAAGIERRIKFGPRDTPSDPSEVTHHVAGNHEEALSMLKEWLATDRNR